MTSTIDVEHVFSVMKNLRTDETKRLRRELVIAELCVKVNLDIYVLFLTTFRESRCWQPQKVHINSLSR